MNSTTMRRLGDYIRQVDVRNRDLKVTRLVGVNLDKEFMPSVANTVGTDMSTYKIVSYNQFGCKLMSVERDRKMPISLMKEEEPALISSAYYVFEVVDENILNPDYLFLQIKNPEFDRRLWFSSGGDVRGGVGFTNLEDMPISVPPIEEQREIVARHKAIEHKIDVNRRLIAKLEETARTIYRHTFVENIDPENLPDGWRLGKLSDIADICSGKTCNSKQDIKSTKFCFPVAGAAGIIGWSNEFNHDERLLTTGRVGTLGVVNRYEGLTYMADNVLVIKSSFFEFCDQILKNFDYEEITKGGVQALITQTELSNIEITIPPITLVEKFEEQVGILSEHVKQYNKEITLLSTSAL